MDSSSKVFNVFYVGSFRKLFYINVHKFNQSLLFSSSQSLAKRAFVHLKCIVHYNFTFFNIHKACFSILY